MHSLITIIEHQTDISFITYIIITNVYQELYEELKKTKHKTNFYQYNIIN